MTIKHWYTKVWLSLLWPQIIMINSVIVFSALVSRLWKFLSQEIHAISFLVVLDIRQRLNIFKKFNDWWPGWHLMCCPFDSLHFKTDHLLLKYLNILIDWGKGTKSEVQIRKANLCTFYVISPSFIATPHTVSQEWLSGNLQSSPYGGGEGKQQKQHCTCTTSHYLEYNPVNVWICSLLLDAKNYMLSCISHFKC